MDGTVIILSLIFLGINIYLLIRFLNLCDDVKKISEKVTSTPSQQEPSDNKRSALIDSCESRLSIRMKELENSLKSYNPRQQPDITPDDLVNDAKKQIDNEITILRSTLSTLQLGDPPFHLHSADNFIEYYNSMP